MPVQIYYESKKSHILLQFQESQTVTPTENGRINYNGKAILVTGAGRGLGREYALMLAARGASILVADKGGEPDGSGTSSTPADAVVGEIHAAGGVAIAYHGDLAIEDGARGAVNAALDGFGRIDGILHNASFASPPQSVDAVSSAQFALMMGVNTFAAFWMANSAWPHMQRQGGGRIVLTGSAAMYGSARNIAYCAAKSSLVGLGRTLAWEGRDQNIFTNILVPTAATRLTERYAPSPFIDWYRKTFLVQNVAPVATYMCHESCTLNGETIAVSGPRIARIRLQESFGDIGPGASIEDARDRMAAALGDERFFYPTDTASRSARIGEILGFDGVASLATR